MPLIFFLEFVATSGVHCLPVGVTSVCIKDYQSRDSTCLLDLARIEITTQKRKPEKLLRPTF